MTRAPSARTARSPVFGLLTCLAVASGCTATGDAGSGNDFDALPRISLEEELRIGSVDDPDYGFTGIGGVDVDRDGNLYVLEQADVQIRVYSPTGELLRRIGRRGEGPGEFRSAPRFGIHGDTLWAIETSGRRISLFRLDGTVISTSPIQTVTVLLARSVGNIMPIAMREDGLFISDMTMFSFSRDMSEFNATDTVQVPRIVYAASGAPVDTIGWTPYVQQQRSGETEWVTVGDNRYIVPRPPSGDPVSVTLPDGRVLIEPAPATSAGPTPLTVTRLGFAGDTVFVRDYVYQPHPFDDAALDAAAWRVAKTPGGGIPILNGVPTAPPVPDDSMDAFNRIRGAMDFPPFQPPIRFNRVGTDGSIWLAREEDGGPDRRWTVLDPEGLLVGEVVLPTVVIPMWMAGDRVIVSDRDEFDVPWLVSYRMHIE